MGKIYIGWAEESIVPDKKVSLAGQFFERLSEYVESDITATAMAVETDGEQAVMVSVDLGNITAGQQAIVREKVKKMSSEIDVSKIFIAATHTHTAMGPARPKNAAESHAFAVSIDVIREFLPEHMLYKAHVTADESVLTAEEALEFVTDKIAKAVVDAWNGKKEALYTNEFGRVPVGMCRRVVYDDGSAQMWGDCNTPNFVSLEGGNDSGVELIYTFDTDKNLTGVIANISCPAQILEQRSFISADYWGATKAYLREKLGKPVYLLGFCGAAGDQSPRDLVRWVEPETPIDDPNVKRPNVIVHKADPSMYDISGCKKVGKRIANEIISVLEDITDLKDEAVFYHKVLTMDLPLRKATMEEYENAVKELQDYVEKNKDKTNFTFEDNARMFVHAGTIARFREQQYTQIHTIESHVLRFGDVAFSTNPFELFLDYGNIIKARSRAAQTFIVQLACGASDYLPTKKAEEGGHYSAYLSSGYVGHEGGDLFTRQTIRAINTMWEAE